MYKAQETDFDDAWSIFQGAKEWFPHVRKSHCKERISRGQLILEDGVLITYHQNKNNRKIGVDTNVRIESGCHIIHQLVNSNKGNGNAEKVVRKFFDYVDTNVYLTVRADNQRAIRLYEKLGMEDLGYINWSKGSLKGKVYGFKNKTLA